MKFLFGIGFLLALGACSSVSTLPWEEGRWRPTSSEQGWTTQERASFENPNLPPNMYPSSIQQRRMPRQPAIGTPTYTPSFPSE